VFILALQGCSLIGGFDGQHFDKSPGEDGGQDQAHDGGSAVVEPDAGKADAAVALKDAGKPKRDAGSLVDAGAQLDASQPQDAAEPDAGNDAMVMPQDAGQTDAGTDAGPVYPHGCAPPTQWCKNLTQCMTKMQLDYHNGQCTNCIRNNVTGEWSCQ